VTSNRAGQLQLTRGPHNLLRIHLKAEHVCTHIGRGGEGGLNYIESAIYKQYVTLKVRLNDKVADLSQVGQTQRMIALVCAALK
jgi:hypothetical protein